MKSSDFAHLVKSAPPANRAALLAAMPRRGTKRNPAAAIGDRVRSVAVTLDGLHAVSIANVRENHFRRSSRTRKHRALAYTALLAHPLPPLPVVVTMTRLGPRALDSDNLHGSLKAVRDGVADAYGVDDGSDLYLWDPKQEIAKTYAVRIVIQRKDETP